MKISPINKIMQPLKAINPESRVVPKLLDSNLKPQTLDEFMQTPIEDHDDFLMKMSQIEIVSQPIKDIDVEWRIAPASL